MWKNIGKYMIAIVIILFVIYIADSLKVQELIRMAMRDYLSDLKDSNVVSAEVYQNEQAPTGRITATLKMVIYILFVTDTDAVK